MKRIIEIEESDLERIREIVERENKTALSVTTRGTAYITIADSKLYDDCGDSISRSKLQEDFKKELNFGSATAYIRKLNSLEKTDLVKLMLSLIDNAPPVPERDYSQGWHDAITKALNEAYTITTEDGSFKVVQTETLEGLGMSMPDKKGEWVEREYRRYLPRDAEPDYNNDTYDEKTHSVIETHIVCSECGATKRFYHKFCGNCGADMRGGAE